MTIELTEKAIQKVEELAVEVEAKPIIRAGVVGGGCSGYSHKLFFEEEDHIQETDSVFEFGQVKVVVDMMSLTYIDGTTIDYVDGLMGTGFKFNNPAAKNTCGCGKSFSA